MHFGKGGGVVVVFHDEGKRGAPKKYEKTIDQLCINCLFILLYRHEDGAGHGDGVKRVEEEREEADVYLRLHSKSPQLGKRGCEVVLVEQYGLQLVNSTLYYW